ncbi:MAG: P-loop NTPase [Byssovorax sp.]
MNKKITLHVFCSVKGGVGKSTLATTCAKLLAANRRVPLLIDADLTGTSLADGLRLCAPKTALLPDGTVDVEAPATGEFMQRDEVARLRRLRRDNPLKKGLPPAYLNDALRPYLESKVEYVGEVHVDALLWKHEVNDGVWYLPSSALRHDLAESLRWFSLDVFDWMGAMTVLLDTVSFQRPDLTDVVIDVPPGLFGFGEEMLAMASMLMRDGLPEGYPDWKNGPVVWDARAFLVTTPDANDVLPVYEYMALNIAKLLRATILLNKSTTVPPQPEEILGPTLGALIDTRRIEQVPFLPQTLGRIFVEGNLNPDEDVRRLSRIFVPEEIAST